MATLLDTLLTNPLVSLSILVSITGVLHVLLIWLYPRSPLFWKRSDYVWLGLAALGLLATTGEVRRGISSELVTTYLIQANAGFNRFAEGIAFDEKAYCDPRRRTPT